MTEKENCYSMDTLFSNDQYAFEDEKLASNVYHTSFSTSQNEIDAIHRSNPQKAAELSEKNNWLLGSLGIARTVPAINFDKIPSLCNVDGLKSPDALLLDYREDSLNLIIEFKNCSKRILEQSYLDPTKDDSIHYKFVDAKRLIASNLSFAGYENVKSFMSKTHIVIVYNGKNDGLSKFPQSKTKKIRVSQNNKGKQNRAAKINFKSKGTENPIAEKFSRAICELGYAKCEKEYFPIPGEPKYKRIKSLGKVRDFSLFSSLDFIRLIEEFVFFESVDYGEYQTYFISADENNNVGQICSLASNEV